MKRCFAKLVLVAVSVATLSLACVPESQAHQCVSPFGFGTGYFPNYYSSAYRGYGFTGYRSAYYAPRVSYYHAPVSPYGWSGFSTNYRSFSSPCGCSPCGNGGCDTGCATGQCGVNYNTQSPTNTYDSDAPVPTPAKIKKFERTDKKDDIDDTGSKTFKPSQNTDENKSDDGGAFGNTKGFDEGSDDNGSAEEKKDGIGPRSFDNEKQPEFEEPKSPEKDPFGDDKEERGTFKIPVKEPEGVEALDKIMDDFNKTEKEERTTNKIPAKEPEGIEALDKIMDDFNNMEDSKPNGGVIKQKGAPTKNPVEENKTSIKKKNPAVKPRLEVKPLGLDDNVAQRRIPTYRRLSIRSRYYAPQIARTRVIFDGTNSSPLHHQPGTKLVSK